MLHLYSDLDFLPKEIEYIRDNVDFFRRVTINKLDERVNGLLRNTDGAVYESGTHFKDKFGSSVPWGDLSTGGMTVLNAYYNPDKCFDTLECGMNALTDIKNLSTGSVFPNHIECLDGVDMCSVIVDDYMDTQYSSYGEWVND